MSFYFPLGLIGLVGVPVLILIYIIKSKYTEQVIASTYLWELSEKFLKKRKPISKLAGIITLILQILAVVAASLLIAHPVFTVPASANDIYFIFDGSASMNMVSDGKTRFERGRDEIFEIIDGSLDGSTYSLIFVNNVTNVMFEGVTDKEQAKANIRSLSSGWCAADCSSAVTMAQDFYDKNRSAVIYLVTDKNYQTENLELVNVSANENNYAFYEYSYRYTSKGVIGSGKVISYESDATLTVELLVGKDDALTTSKIAEVKVDAKKGEPCEFEITASVSNFTSLQLRISNGDALLQDNVITMYDETSAQSRRALLVTDSNDSVYLEHAISNAGKAIVERIPTKEYSDAYAHGYGMYVFSGFTPKTLPTNAAVWLLNAADGTGNGSGLTYRDMQVPRDETGPDSYYTPKYTSGTSAQEKALTRDLVKSDIAIRQYAKYGVPRNFVPVMSVGGDPVICVGLNENNDRQVVFAFELGDSDFALKGDFLILVRNLMNYSFPSVIDATTYNCGDVMNVNVVPGCENIVVTTPSGNSTTLDTVGNDVCEVELNETGTYTLRVKTVGSAETTLYAFAAVPESESRFEDGGALVLSGEREFNYSDGYYDELLAFFILIALLLLADWGIYCYEQYQLR